MFPDLIGTFMGRDALALATSHLGLGSADTVLLPAYTCQEVLKSFARKVNVLFYDVQDDLTIDPDEIRRQIRGRRVRMLVITDYFGFLQPYRSEIKCICDQEGICLVEDCAHSLLTEGAGQVGHLAIFSFRKILPVPDGGGLRVNKDHAASVEPRFFPKVCVNIRTPMFSRARIASHTTDLIATASEAPKDARILPLSYFSKHAMTAVSFSDIVRRRREDFEHWRELCLAEPSIVPLFRTLPAGVCPLGFPVKVKERGSLEARARKAGIVLSVHWRLENRIGSECRTSHQLSKEMLTLPLYSDLKPGQRGVLGDIIQGWRACA
jgi:hypothetical protein